MPRHVAFSKEKIASLKAGDKSIADLKTLMGDDEQAFEQFLSKDLEKLYNFVQRELQYHDALDDLPENELDPYDLINAAILKILDKKPNKPLKLGQAIYAEVLDQIQNAVAKLEEQERRETSVEKNINDAAEEDGFTTLGEQVLDFWQPDQDLNQSDVIADKEVPTPAEIEDMKDRQAEIYLALDALPKVWREDFIFLAVEHWSVKKLSEMRDVKLEKMQEQLKNTQAFLQERLREKLLLSNRKPGSGKHAHNSD